MNEQEEILSYAMLFNEALTKVFQDNQWKDEKSYAVTTGMSIAFFDIIRQICVDGENKDLIDSMHVAERLLIDYLVKYGNPLDLEGEKDDDNYKEEYDKCFDCKYAVDNTCLQHDFNSHECRYYKRNLEDMMMELQKSLP